MKAIRTSEPLISSTAARTSVWAEINGPVLDCVQARLRDGESVVANISGSCMNPTLRDGDQVTIVSRRHYLPGDVIAYFCPCLETWIAHRFLGYVLTNHQWKFMLMADSACKPDILIEKKYIIGKVVATEFDAFPVRLSQRFTATRRYIFWVLKTGFGRLLSDNQSAL